MLNLNYLFGELPPAVVDHQLLLVAVGTVAYWLILRYHKGESRKLTHIPSTESDLPLFCFRGSFKYLFDARKLIKSGLQKWPNRVFKIPDLLHWIVVITEPSMVDEIRKAPDNVLSFIDAADDMLQIDFTLGEHMRTNPYHIPILRSQLTRALPQLVPEIHEEIVDAFNEFIPLTSDWTSFKALETFMNIVCRASNRIFVGLPLCRDPDFAALNVQFTTDVLQAAVLLRLFPPFLRPLVNKLISNVPNTTQQSLKYFAPVLAARRKQSEEKPLDLITWLMDEAKDKEATDWYLTSRILLINFAAIHTSSMAFTHAIYYLAAFPEYMKPLREEVEEIIQREGWTKPGIDQMYKIDSFIRESQRLHPLGILSQRTAVNDYTFSDGTMIPRGTMVAVALDSIHLNEKNYPDPLTFDPWRFVKLREQDITGKRFDMIATGLDLLAFGYGRHACPGRHFAACELKLMLAHLVMTYDMKLENEGGRPKDMWVASHCVPNANAKVLFRKRVL